MQESVWRLVLLPDADTPFQALNVAAFDDAKYIKTYLRAEGFVRTVPSTQGSQVGCPELQELIPVNSDLFWMSPQKRECRRPAG